VPTTAGTRPLSEQLMDGDQIRWQDIVATGYEQAWVDSYKAAPLELRWSEVRERSEILQQVRERLGLPARAGSRSAEYQAYIDGWVMEVAVQAATWKLGELFKLVRVIPEAISAADDFFVTMIRMSATGERSIGAILASGAGSTPIVLPALEDAAEVAVSAATRNGAKVTALVTQRDGAKALLSAGGFTEAQKEVASAVVNATSRELGAIGLEDYITTQIGSRGTRLYSGRPLSGGGATGEFDEVVEITKDAAGNPLSRIKYFIGEAKGAGEPYDIVTKAPGRRVTLRDGRLVYALQGTKEYVEGIAVAMVKPTKPAAVRAAGQKILDKIALNEWDDLEYAFVVSRWVTHGNRVRAMSPVLQVTKTVLR
jgi:hypothetical protein